MKRLTAAEITAAVGGVLAAGDGEHPITGSSIDSRTVKEGDLFIPIIGERMDGHRFIPEALKGGCGAVLIMEDHPLPEETGSLAVIRCKDTTKALQDLARWYLNALSIRRIGVTGSTGKTTTKEMIYHICSEKYKTQRNLGNFNNHIGLPLTILSFEEGTEVGVLEMGMSSPGEIDLLAELVRPEIAVITNIGTAHIENLGSREEILKAKLEITHYFSEDDLLIINRDNDLLKQIQDPPYRLVTIGENGKSHLILSAITDLGEKGIVFTLSVNQGIPTNPRNSAFIYREGTMPIMQPWRLVPAWSWASPWRKRRLAWKNSGIRIKGSPSVGKTASRLLMTPTMPAWTA